MDEYRFGGIVLRWDDGGCPLLPGNLAQKFRHSGALSSERITLRARFAHLAPLLQNPCLHSGPVFDRYEVEGEPLLVYHWGHLPAAFGIFPHRIGAEGGDACFFDPDMARQVPLPFDWFLGVSGLHRALLRRDAPILHASYIAHQGGAILFAAPSQTGKSTQAQLWHDHAGAEIVNGDRALLRRLDGRWHACGFPCSGSSEFCENRTLPLRAIVLLAQGPEDGVEELPLSRQMTGLLSGMQVYPWDQAEVDRAFDLAGLIAREVPVVRLTCTPTRNAVETLRQYLEVKGYV